MRKLIGSAVLIVGAMVAWACIPAGQSVFLVSSQLLGSDCTIDFGTERTFGTLNTAISPDYIVAFSMESTMIANETTANGQPVDSPSSNDFIGQQAVLSYETIENGVRSPLSITDQIQPLLAVVAPGSDREGSAITMNLFTPAASTAVASLPSPTDLIVSVRIDGQLRGGKPLSTNTIEFPIRLVNVTPACDAGEDVVVATGACGNPGQDSGAGFACVAQVSSDGGIIAPVDPSGF